MKLYNTLSKKIEEFKPHNPPKVTLYACGPTVYDYAHIGNFRTYTLTDLLVRTLRYFDYDVLYVMNITDVGHLVSDEDSGEDKLEKGARREGKNAREIADHYTEAFLNDSKLLNLIEPDFRPKPTEHIKEQLEMIKTLMEKGYAYKIDDGIYFDTAKFGGYGILTGQNPEDLKAGARVEQNLKKRNPTDFALWKLSPIGVKRQMEWDSPWGIGFPGWHIECSAMSRKYLGDQVDIHTGGMDLVPIHHTNEIAQSEAASGRAPFVRYWVHGQFVNVDSEKMSKSKGNFYTVKDILAKSFPPLSLRYLYLTAHYRSYLNFTWQALENARNSLAELRRQAAAVRDQAASGSRLQLSGDKLKKVEDFQVRFDRAIGGDLNLPEALAVVWETVKSNIPSQDKSDLLRGFDRVLGLKLFDNDSDQIKIPKPVSEKDLPDEIRNLIGKREEFRKKGDYKEADRIRDRVFSFGFTLEDTPTGLKISEN